MIGVIIGSRKIGINPDNVATPIAASLGDLITLALLSGISWGLYLELGEAEATEPVTQWTPGRDWERWAWLLQACERVSCVLYLSQPPPPGRGEADCLGQIRAGGWEGDRQGTKGWNQLTNYRREEETVNSGNQSKKQRTWSRLLMSPKSWGSL